MIYFIDYTDFADSEFNLEINEYNLNTFESIANDVIYDVLNDLLGADLYNKLLADLDANKKPQTQKYKNLVDGMPYYDTLRNNKIVNYQGINDMLKYFVFCEYKLFKLSYDATTGTVQPNNENSIVLTDIQLKSYLQKYYTKAVFLYRKVVKFLKDNYLNNQNDYFTSVEYANWYPKPYNIESEFTTLTITPKNYYSLNNQIVYK